MNNEISYDMKSGLPNKMINDDGTVTDLIGKTVANPVQSWENKPALPNKWLNPDGTYSTLKEIITEAVDTDIFVIVDELPEEGDISKIYLVPDKDGHFIEYLWVNDKWDAVGMIEFDLSKYSTTDEMNQAILVALNSAKEYADNKLIEAKNYTDEQLANIDLSGAIKEAEDYADSKAVEVEQNAKAYTDLAIQNIPQDPEFFYVTGDVTSTSWSDFWKNLYDPTNNTPFIAAWYSGNTNGNDGSVYTWYFENHNFTNGVSYVGYNAMCGDTILNNRNSKSEIYVR